MVLRLNYLHPQLDPDDNVAFQEVCQTFNEPKAGSLMDPVGVAILVLAHALKWPPVVRHYLDTLRGLMSLLSVGRANATIIVDAFYDAASWSDGKPLAGMHAVLSVAGRAHAVSGVAVAAGQLGLVSTKKPADDEYKVISLGPVGKTYYLRPRGALAACERVVES